MTFIRSRPDRLRSLCAMRKPICNGCQTHICIILQFVNSVKGDYYTVLGCFFCRLLKVYPNLFSAVQTDLYLLRHSRRLGSGFCRQYEVGKYFPPYEENVHSYERNAVTESYAKVFREILV